MHFGLDIFLEAVVEIYVVWEHGVNAKTFREIEAHVFKIAFLANFCNFFRSTIFEGLYLQNAMA